MSYVVDAGCSILDTRFWILVADPASHAPAASALFAVIICISYIVCRMSGVPGTTDQRGGRAAGSQGLKKNLDAHRDRRSTIREICETCAIYALGIGICVKKCQKLSKTVKIFQFHTNSHP